MVITSTGLPCTSIERPGVVMLDVGLRARWATIGWPDEIPPRMPNRLEQARRKLYDLLQNRSDAQTAVIVYAGSAHTLVPLQCSSSSPHEYR